MSRWIMAATVLAAGTVACTMLLGGCGRKSASRTDEETAAMLTGDFTAGVTVTLGELEAAADLTRTGGETTVALTSPEHLEGLVFTADGVCYKGLAVEGTEMPMASLGRAMDEVLDALSAPGTAGSGGSDELPSLRGSTAGGEFTLTLEDGMPGLLELPALDLTVRFTSFTPAEPSGTPIPEENSGSSAVPEESDPQDVVPLQEGSNV